jgi:hypothetical protein
MFEGRVAELKVRRFVLVGIVFPSLLMEKRLTDDMPCDSSSSAISSSDRACRLRSLSRMIPRQEFNVL